MWDIKHAFYIIFRRRSVAETTAVHPSRNRDVGVGVELEAVEELAASTRANSDRWAGWNIIPAVDFISTVT